MGKRKKSSKKKVQKKKQQNQNQQEGLNEFVQEKKPIFRFLIAFGFSVLIFYIFYNSGFYAKYLQAPVLNSQANVSASLLRLIGYPVYTFGDVISLETFQISIKGGCDGLESTALFVLAILVFPIPFRYKWKGILAGLFILGILNIIRISGLFMIGIHLNTFFEFFHLHGGVVLFTLASIVLWVVWVNWSFNQLSKQVK